MDDTRQEVTKKPVFTELLDDFNIQMDNLNNSICKIEDKLIKIGGIPPNHEEVSLKFPGDDRTDFAASLREISHSLRSKNTRLEQICMHLNELI